MAIFYKLSSFLPSVDSSKFSTLYTMQVDIKRKLTNYENTEHSLRLLKRDSDVNNGIYSYVINNASNSCPNKSNINYSDNNDIKFDKRRLMWKRFLDINEWLSENCHTFEEIETFYKKVDKLTIVSITCNDLGDAFSIFSSINAKGLPLTLIDLIKVEYLSTAGASDESLINIYEEKWIQLLDIFSETDKDSNHSKVIQFLQNYYDTFINTTASSITKKKP